MAGEAHHSISSNGGTEWKAARENAGARSFQTCATSSSTVSGRHSLARFQKFGREALHAITRPSSVSTASRCRSLK